MRSNHETSEHETVRALVDEHFTVGLRADREARLRAHLPTCPSCRTAYEAYQIAEGLDPAAVPARERLARSLGFGADTRGRIRVSGWTGATLAMGETGLFHLVAARGDDGTVLTSSWVDGQAQSLPIDDGELLPGLAESLVGMQVGGRRVITLPYDPESGLTPETDVVVIADLLATY